ncbi:MAG: hypothetical protein V1855_03645 [bacterium]
MKNCRKKLLYICVMTCLNYGSTYSAIENNSKKDVSCHDKLIKKFENLAEKSEIFAGEYKDYWFYFWRKDSKENMLINNHQKSHFFPHTIQSFARYKNSRCNLYYHLLFCNLDQQPLLLNKFIQQKIKIFTDLSTKLEQHIQCFKKLTQNQQIKAQQEIVDGLACRYKIHLQVKPQYLASVVKKLLPQLSRDEFKHIYNFKVTTKFIYGLNYYKKDNSSPEHASPIIALYVALLPGTKEEKNIILNELIHNLEKIFNTATQKIALQIHPRFNLKINDLIYIAGGEGWNKQLYLSEENIKQWFSENLVFFKGHEFEYHKH